MGLDQEGFQDLRALKAFTEAELLWTSTRKSPEHLAAATSSGAALLGTVLIRERNLYCLESKCCCRKCNIHHGLGRSPGDLTPSTPSQNKAGGNSESLAELVILGDPP